MGRLKVVIYDIEVLKEIFLIVIYIPETNEWKEFYVHRYGNTLDGFIAFTEDYKEYYWTGYNCLRYDSQIIEHVIRNNEYWYNKTWKEICEILFQLSKDTISDANYEIFPKYREEDLFLKQLDLFTIWHFNNVNRRTSLKALAFALNMEDIEELPIAPEEENLSKEDIKKLTEYCYKDVTDTYAHYLVTIGETSISLYKGEDKIADRLIMKDEYNLDCLNWDDVKIGSEWNKLDYKTATRRLDKDLKPEKIIFPFGKRFKEFFPKYITFQTPELRKFVREIGNQFVKNQKQEFKYIFNDELTVTIAKGGAHSCEGGRFIKPLEDEMYIQCDQGSQYPNAIRKHKVEPKHLPGWNRLIVSKIERRLHFKDLYKETKDPKYNSLQKMGKLALNGGAYGRLNTKGDWQEYPYGMLQVTMGCQLDILMIIEDLIVKGFRVVSVNTDGFDIIIKRKREQEFKDVLSRWEERIGNSELGNFEYTEFKWIAQTSVNDYIALKADNTLKTKGDFEIDKELNKNTSARIVPIALREYFVNGTPVEKTIKEHDNIYDFCIRQKSSKYFHYEGVKDNNVNVYNKLIRYYVSNKGEKIYKIKNPECLTNAPQRAQIEAGEWLCIVCNYLPKTTQVKDCDLNFDYYIDRTERIICKINKKYKRKKLEDKLQLSLW